MEEISGWGRYPRVMSEVLKPNSRAQLLNETDSALARGLGRSYGDSALSDKLVSSEYLDNFISFDNETGVLCCEAGVSLANILEVFVPKGWFLHVTPGTKFVTVGGAVASDVHGKNHHLEGSFGSHVKSLKVLIGEKEYSCSATVNPELFYATCGGMGLSGVIISVELQLKPIESAYIDQRIIKAKNLDEILDLFETYQNSEYTVAWIDCLSSGSKLGRSLFYMGNHSQSGDLDIHSNRSLSFPLNAPSFAMNRLTVGAFNQAYYHKHLKKEVCSRVHYDPFFYPLDSIANWNRMYGKQGFLQYQLVCPISSGREALHDIVSRIAKSGLGSFLAVLKLLGKGNKNYLSFPCHGYTLALDFKVSNKAFQLLLELDDIVLKNGGRLYLSKDARMPEAMFKKSYPKWQEFNEVRRRYGAYDIYSSSQSYRLGLSEK